MDINNIKYVYVDLDGTIVNSNGIISTENIKAIRYLQSKSIRVGIVSGRCFFNMQEEIDIVKPNLPIIGCNGSTIYSTNKTIVDEEQLPFSSKKVIDILIDYGFSFVIYSPTGIYTNSENNYYFRKLFQRILNYEEKYRIFEFEQVNNLDWLKSKKKYKILVSYDTPYEKELLEDKLKNIEDINLVFMSEGMLEINSKKASKGIALKRVTTSLSINMDEVMVFGDNHNDLSMFNVVKNSVSMLNASDEIKEKTKYVTEKTCDDDGFANFVFKYF